MVLNFLRLRYFWLTLCRNSIYYCYLSFSCHYTIYTSLDSFLLSFFHSIVKLYFSFIRSYFIVYFSITRCKIFCTNNHFPWWIYNNSLFCSFDISCFWIIYVLNDSCYFAWCKITYVYYSLVYCWIIDNINIYFNITINSFTIISWLCTNFDNLFFWCNILISEFFFCKCRTFF